MKAIFVIWLLVLACTAGVSGQGPSKSYFTDTVVVDQDGRQRRFYTDLLEGNVVVINAFHTNCTSTVPVMTATLRALQRNLASRAKEFNILSMSVDPTDDAARAKAFAVKYEAGPGWYFVTGEKANMAEVLKKLGMYVENKEDHSTVIIVGNMRTGLWKKAYGLAKAEDIEAVVLSVLDDKGK